MATWPSTLPMEFEASSFEDEFPEQLIYSPIDKYDSDTRQINRLEVKAPLKGNMIMDTIQWSALLNWYINTIGSGAISFNFPNPDNISETIRVIFISPPKLSTIGGDTHIITLDLEYI